LKFRVIEELYRKYRDMDEAVSASVRDRRDLLASLYLESKRAMKETTTAAIQQPKIAIGLFRDGVKGEAKTAVEKTAEAFKIRLKGPVKAEARLRAATAEAELAEARRQAAEKVRADVNHVSSIVGEIPARVLEATQALTGGVKAGLEAVVKPATELPGLLGVLADIPGKIGEAFTAALKALTDRLKEIADDLLAIDVDRMVEIYGIMEEAQKRIVERKVKEIGAVK